MRGVPFPAVVRVGSKAVRRQISRRPVAIIREMDRIDICPRIVVQIQVVARKRAGRQGHEIAYARVFGGESGSVGGNNQVATG